jgi:hypothetical protein
MQLVTGVGWTQALAAGMSIRPVSVRGGVVGLICTQHCTTLPQTGTKLGPVGGTCHERIALTLTDVRVLAAPLERTERPTERVAQVELARLRYIVDVYGCDACILVEVDEVAVAVPVNIKADVLFAAPVQRSPRKPKGSFTWRTASRKFASG